MQEKQIEREGRRKDIWPVNILLGHKVKNFMTVIAKVSLLDGVLSDSKIYQQSADCIRLGF